MSDQIQVRNASIELVQGDITAQQVDTIVNAANSSLMGGGGVDGAIHRAGGPQILEECKAIRAQQGKLPTGQAVATTGGKLPARWVIHGVGPIWRGGQAGEPKLLASCYQNSLAIARDKGAQSVAFPSISTGAYRYPLAKAALISLATVRDELIEHGSPALVRFVLFDATTLAAYRDALTALIQ